ncbi:MAG TPA: CoA-transferase [Candidatus Polarisedimenticolia bacterium]|jgi:acyl CoA:acetate/3-ketoacid CoA transferase beta subunit|nr:CoA-transferase [Candidatus Polarisedimenticolia bacterium]
MSPTEEMKRNSTVANVRATEIMAAAGARELHDGEVVIVGLGLPEIATVLAKRTHAPGLSALLEVGVMNPIPKDTPVGLGDSRIFYRSTCWSSYLDVMGMNLHRGVVDVGFLGALEVDRYGSINTTLLKQDAGKVRYVNGSAGGNDVASLAKRVIVIMRHEKRKLPMAVAHLTSPGFVGGHSRNELALRGGGPHRVITDMAVLGFDPNTHSACLVSLHPGTRLEEVIENTGFALQIPKEVPATPLPTAEELRLLREEIDPKGVHLK